MERSCAKLRFPRNNAHTQQTVSRESISILPGRGKNIVVKIGNAIIRHRFAYIIHIIYDMREKIRASL